MTFNPFFPDAPVFYLANAIDDASGICSLGISIKGGDFLPILDCEDFKN